MAKIFYVDIPDINQIGTTEPTFVNVKTFLTKETAISFCKREFGADENGCICLISEGSDD